MTFSSLLKKVSRSFYFSLKILPTHTQEVFSLSYLLARLADTITDHPQLDLNTKEQFLKSWSELINTPDKIQKFVRANLVFAHAESPELSQNELFNAFPKIVNEIKNRDEFEQEQIHWALNQLIQGMLNELNHFSNSNEIQALPSWDTLDKFTYLAAGVVGEFWTRILFHHEPKLLKNLNPQKMETWGKEFGQGLQVINILKDWESDLNQGRCYFPKQELDKRGIHLNDNHLDIHDAKLNSLINQMILLSLKSLKSGQKYLLCLPKNLRRYRLAVIWPLWIGLETLKLIKENRGKKISKSKLYWIFISSLPASFSNNYLEKKFFKLSQSF